MKRQIIATALALSAAVSAPSFAQAPALPTGPPPTGIVVGSGNFFSPIVANLDAALAFYREGLGLDVQGAPANADTNPALRNMFGLPDAQLRWSIGRPAGMRTGVEIVEISKANGKAIERRIQDPGAFTLIAFVRDLDAVFARLTKQGAPVVTSGGAPIKVSLGAQGSGRAVIVKDPAGHFVELVQPDRVVDVAPAGSDVTAVRVRLTVDDLDKAVKLYRDSLGLAARSVGDFHKDAPAMDMMGLKKDAQIRFAVTDVPTTGLTFEFIEFKGVDRRTVRGNIQDPGSTRMQIQVRDVDAAIAALKSAGSAVVSTGGTTVELPGRGGATTKVAIVREPNNLFLVLLQAAAPQRTP